MVFSVELRLAKHADAVHRGARPTVTTEKGGPTQIDCIRLDALSKSTVDFRTFYVPRWLTTKGIKRELVIAKSRAYSWGDVQSGRRRSAGHDH